jgi:hypothetical protein
LQITNKGCCHTLWPCASILRQKKTYENSNISPCKNIKIIQKQSSKPNQTKILQDIIIITLYNQPQVSTQAKISSFKNPHIKIDLLLLLLLLLPRGQNPLS